MWKAQVWLCQQLHIVSGTFPDREAALSAAKEYAKRLIEAPPSRVLAVSEMICKRCGTINRVRSADPSSILNSPPLTGVPGSMDSQVYCCSCDREHEYESIGTVQGVLESQEYREGSEEEWRVCFGRETEES
jgi:hypothetical protein